MKAAIKVTDKQEAQRVSAALEDPTVRAFVNVMGALASLDEHRRAQVMAFVGATLDGRTTPVRPALPLDLGKDLDAHKIY